SALNFTPAGDSIRFGLGAIKNVGANAVESILKARQEGGGSFHGLFEFCETVDAGAVNRRMIESFIKAGAMDSLAGNRAQLFAVLDPAMEAGQRAWRDRSSGQVGLFGDLFAAGEAEERPLPKVPDWTQKEKLTGEKETIGVYVTGHPLDEFRDKVRDLATHDSSTLEGLERGAQVALCGMIGGMQRRRNKEGKLWASFQLEDLLGQAECMCFATAFEQIQQDLVDDRPVLIRGMALPDENGPARISVKEVTPLDLVRINLPSLVSIRVNLNMSGAGRAGALSALFQRKPGEAEVRLRLEKPRDFSVVLDVSTRVRPDKEFVEEVEKICGPQAFEVLAS
ncbi:MAG: DNA polymerase III subunit alpha, partial [Bryobacteraceae bacterium]